MQLPNKSLDLTLNVTEKTSLRQLQPLDGISHVPRVNDFIVNATSQVLRLCHAFTFAFALTFSL